MELASKQLHALKEARDDAWEHLKVKVNLAWSDLKKEIEIAMSKFE